MSKKPTLDFIILGFAKCGTTTLHALLADHPEIYMSRVKEPRFFCDENYHNRWPWYQSLFEHAPVGALRGEASVRYSEAEFEVLSRQRIMQHYPDIKVVFIARDPIHRIESQFREHHSSGYLLGISCPFSLAEALRKFPNMIHDTLYLQRYNNYRQYLPRENIHVLFLEELKQNTQQALQKLCRFLGIDDGYVPDDLGLIKNHGATKYRDTALFRTLKQRRHKGENGFTLRHLPFHERQRIWRRNGWRVPFGKEPIIWPDDPWAILGEAFAEDCLQFLHQQGRTISLWPAFEKKLSLRQKNVSNEARLI